jgi:5-formyltetrahydrofolate cyclo-ligase
LRGELIARRDALAATDRAAWSRAIASVVLASVEVRAAECVFCFVSVGTEVHTHGIIDTLLARGKTVLIPKVPRGGPMRAVPMRGWNDLVPGTLGIPAPHGSEPWTGYVDVVVTPGLGFTAAGRRLGYGKGYYDHWFATHAHGVRIGVAFDCQVVGDLPVTDTDVPVHRLVTESRA